MKRWTLLGYGILMVSIFLISYVEPAVSQTTEELKVGVIGPLSGPGAPWGLPWQRGVLMAAEDVNKTGGIKVKGEKYLIKVISDDDKYQPATTTSVAHRLIDQHGIKFICGTIGSPTQLALQAVTEPVKVITFGGGAATPLRIGSKKPYSFSAHLPATERVAAGYGWLSKTYPKIKRHAGFAPNDETGRVFVDNMVSSVGDYGWKNVALELYERGVKDFYPLLSKIIAQKPDLLDLGICPPGDIALLVKQARELGFREMIVALAPLDLDALVKIAGPQPLEGFVSTAMQIPGDHISRGEAEFYERYMKTYGPPFMEAAMDANNVLMALKIAIEQTGSLTDTDVIAKALEKIDFQSIRGHYFMGGEKTYGIKRQSVYEYILSQFRNGKGVNISRVQGVVP